jgi:hypothetical protein
MSAVGLVASCRFSLVISLERKPTFVLTGAPQVGAIFANAKGVTGKACRVERVVRRREIKKFST